MIFVRALWGDNSVVTYQKALWDVRDRFSALPDNIDLRIVAYGQHNADLLAPTWGERVIYQPEQLPEEYDRINPDRPKPLSARRPGTVIDGVMMWWHKLHAIRTAMLHEPRCEEVLWLDWDTKILKQPDKALYDILRAGPAFQSCECPWRTPRAPWRTGTNAKWAFHGGCYYFRGLDLIQRGLELHAAQFCLYSDETVVTWLADHELAGQACENARLYQCRTIKDHLKGIKDHYFHEGIVMHWKDAAHHAQTT